MAASDFENNEEPPAAARAGKDRSAPMSAASVGERLEEEINRSARHGSPPSCPLRTVRNLGGPAPGPGEGLTQQPPSGRRRRSRSALRRLATGARSAPHCIIKLCSPNLSSG